MLLRNTSTGGSEVYDINNNQITGAVSDKLATIVDICRKGVVRTLEVEGRVDAIVIDKAVVLALADE